MAGKECVRGPLPKLRARPRLIDRERLWNRSRACDLDMEVKKMLGESRLRKVYPYYFTFTTFTKGRWVGEKIIDVFAREFRAHPAEEYERCIKAGTLTVNYEKVDIDYKLKHNDLLANIVHR
ncbi:hypothetical protein RUM44_003536 [Polyplax serrata]|uniref:Uncharacterized protein n=1 Tax=Polyplax serrata TaxID=468196 RepID=A0ABR1AGR4_POLSC